MPLLVEWVDVYFVAGKLLMIPRWSWWLVGYTDKNPWDTNKKPASRVQKRSWLSKHILVCRVMLNWLRVEHTYLCLYIHCSRLVPGFSMLHTEKWEDLVKVSKISCVSLWVEQLLSPTTLTCPPWRKLASICCVSKLVICTSWNKRTSNWSFREKVREEEKGEKWTWWCRMGVGPIWRLS